MTTTSHSSLGALRRHCITAVACLAAVAAFVAREPAAPAHRVATTVNASVSNADVLARAAAPKADAEAPRTFSYGWPVRPFDRQHPVRGSFADPRSIFLGAPTRHGLLTSACACSYHQGIDISAPDGTPVYPVRSGTVRIVTSEWVEVDSNAGSAFQYWHIAPLVRVGDHVEERRTVLGHILKASNHVHLTQLQDGRAVNPLAAGNIGPYADATTPHVNRIEFRASDAGSPLLPEFLHGRVELVADASDEPAIPVPGRWNGLPVTPAKITFRVEHLPDHRVAIAETVAADVTRSLPATPDMWHTYARGTHMNMVKMGSHRYWFQPGVYLFKLTPTPFDTHRLRDGAYALIVTASDTAGNHSSSTQIFSVHNRASWLGA